MTTRVTFRLNGTPAEVEVHDREVLLTTLRDRLGERGVRTACRIGECGACTVLVDGIPTATCRLPATDVAGAAVVTPSSADVDAVREVFQQADAAQCGYCANGIMMTVHALACQGEPPPGSDLTGALDRHLCRCGSHPALLRAARAALGPSTSSPPGTADATGGWTVGSRPPVADDRLPGLPRELRTNPQIEQWLRLTPQGGVEISSGRTEMGQGVHVALRQIVAGQVGLTPDLVTLVGADTRTSPDEGFTSGSRSMQQGGLALAMAARALRRVALERVGDETGIPPPNLAITPDGRVCHGDSVVSSLIRLAARHTITGDVTEDDQPIWQGGALGSVVEGTGLRAALSGDGAFVQDVVLPGMVHARAVLPPSHEAELLDLDVGDIRDRPGIRDVLVDGRLVIVLADDETSAITTAGALGARARWHDPGLPIDGSLADTFRGLDPDRHVLRDDPTVGARLEQGRRLVATYSRPYQAHAAIAPSGAVAQYDGDQLHVWSQTQGVHPLRAELATLFSLGTDDVVVRQVPGPGCYGHNGADDAAAFAAFAALAVPGVPVHFQFSCEDEFLVEPYGSAMFADVEASIDDTGQVLAWRYRALTDVHGARPGGQGDRLAVAWLRAGSGRRPRLGASELAARTSDPLYDLPAVQAVADHVRGPLRTGSLRSLGAFLHVFAIESFMDELAELAGEDPLQFRLRHLRDPRAREVLQVAAETAGWRHRVGPSGRGLGLAVTRYGGDRAYVAQVAEVDVDVDRQRLAATRLTVVCDAGVVINPGSLRQQLEGGVVQGLSRAFIEQIRVDRRGVHSRDWPSYPVIGFADVPPIDLTVIDRPGRRPLGVGEAATPVVAPSIANAIDDRLGVRVRSLPITAVAIRERLLEVTGNEAARVLT